MGTKTISIMDDVYAELVKHKKKDESFSEEIRRILRSKKHNISGCIGLWKDIPKKEIEMIEEGIRLNREFSHKTRLEKLKR